MSDKTDAEARIIGQAMSDANFRKKLLADPVQTLKAAGVEVPEGVSVRVVEDTATLVHMALPRRPATVKSPIAISAWFPAGCAN